MTGIFRCIGNHAPVLGKITHPPIGINRQNATERMQVLEKKGIYTFIKMRTQGSRIFTNIGVFVLQRVILLVVSIEGFVYAK